jgi:glycosyltransferase involved in cell wall biosynthesis
MVDAIIVVPCFNEAAQLDVEVFKRFAPEGRTLRFLFVNDGSTDGTGAMLGVLAAADPHRFGVLHLPRNMGKAEAVRQGMLAALDSEPRYTGFWDADLATPLEAIQTFCDFLDGREDYAMVLGARVKLLGRHIKRRLHRHYLGRLFATAAALVLGFEIYDTQCGAKLFRAGPETRGLFADPFVSRWLFDVEILARFAAGRYQSGLLPAPQAIYEYPLMFWQDRTASKLRLRDFLRAPLDLARIRWKYPTHFVDPGVMRESGRPEAGGDSR